MRALLLGALAIVVWPATADAARVFMTHSTGTGGGGKDEIVGGSVAHFVGSPGEANEVVVSGIDGPWRFTDVIPIEVGEGCRLLDERTAECSGGYPQVRLGDGDDRARCELRLCIIDGGGGGDVIETTAAGILRADGGEGDDVLRGNDREDSLNGGAGSDVLLGGGGTDDLSGDDVAPPYSADRMDGGDGFDRLSYGGRTEPVRVTLGAGGGAPGEDDVIAGVEYLAGGVAADVLIGDDGPNFLAGDPYTGGGAHGERLIGRGGEDTLLGTRGRDVLDGGAGDDELIGRGGADRYRGGSGDDRLLVTEGEYVRSYAQRELACGTGVDRVVGPAPQDTVPRACESVRVLSVIFGRLDGALAFRVQPANRRYLRCGATLQARAGSRRLARRFVTHRGATLRFPGMRRASLTMRLHHCRDRGPSWLAGGFRVPAG